MMYGKLASVSENVYVEDRPLAVPHQMDDFVVVSIPYGFRDKNVMQTALLRVELVVRNKENGVVNVEKLHSMSESFMEMLPIKEDRFFIHDPQLALKGGDNAGFTIWCLHCKIEIYTVDRYEI